MTRYLVVGGGVAGVSCAEELCRANPAASITLLSSCTSFRGVTNYVKLTDVLETFDVEDIAHSTLQSKHPNLSCFIGIVSALDRLTKTVVLSDGRIINYDRICICTGAIPRTILSSPNVVCIRDIEVGGAGSRVLGGLWPDTLLLYAPLSSNCQSHFSQLVT